MSEAVHSPSHYKRGGVELADAIDAFELGRWETQAAQYLFRARHKDGGAHEGQDLKKSVWFTLRRLRAIDPAGLGPFLATLSADFAPAPAPGRPAIGRLVPRAVPAAELHPDMLFDLTVADAIACLGDAAPEGDPLALLNAERARFNAPPATPGDSLGFALGATASHMPIVLAFRRAARVHFDSFAAEASGEGDVA
jgi:hypothetical protein